MLDLTAIQLYCDLVETRSFSRTAERFFVSQSAVSQRIRVLERELEQSLLERSKGKSRVSPTPAGQLLYEQGKRLLQDASELEAQVRGLSEVIAGEVRVATVYSVGLHALPGRLKPFLRANRQVNVHLEYSQTGKVYQDVLSGAVDVGIVACPTPKTGIEIIPFGEERMAVVCPPEHPFAELPEIALCELENQPFLAFADSIPTRRLIDQKLLERGISVRIVMAFDNIETIKNLVEIGSGVSIVPEETVRKEVNEGTLVVIPLTLEDSFLRPAGLLIRETGTRRAAVRAFLDAMRGRAVEGGVQPSVCL